MIKIPFNATTASEKLIVALISSGILYTDENGIHAAEQGIYFIKQNPHTDR